MHDGFSLSTMVYYGKEFVGTTEKTQSLTMNTVKCAHVKIGSVSDLFAANVVKMVIVPLLPHSAFLVFSVSFHVFCL